ncbi:cupin domain-containing protein [Paenibacillus sp. GCM10028914]|uniref:cupin domain-containing protein n=1 Tax=Paenibacillus sp. GCM10028914 TaxID=3273416 RepID=UPI0036230895
MTFSALNRTDGLYNTTLVWNLHQHAKTCSTGSQSDLTSNMIPLLSSMSMTEYEIQRGQTIPSHWHTDADELCYVLNGEFTISITRPQATTSFNSLYLTTGCVAYIPAGWLHEIISLRDQSKLISIYNKENPHLITGLDAFNLVMENNQPFDAQLTPQPVFSRNIPSSTAHNELKRSSSPAPPFLKIRT